MAEEFNMGEEPNVNMKQSFITIEKPTSGTKERNEQLSCQSNKRNDKVR